MEISIFYSKSLSRRFQNTTYFGLLHKLFLRYKGSKLTYHQHFVLPDVHREEVVSGNANAGSISTLKLYILGIIYAKNQSK